MGKIGLCFSGEGARGAIQAGIALGLHQSGIQADFTIGTSSGCACAAGYAYVGPEKVADMWRNVKSIFGLFRVNWLFPWKTGLLNQKPMSKIVHRFVQNKPLCESMALRMNIETGVVEYVLNTMVKPEEFAEAVLGAVAVTGMVEDRNGWVDAGSREMAPLHKCIEQGCDDIYVILGRPLLLPFWNKPKGFMSIPYMGYRALDINLYELLLRDLDKCLKNPNVKIHLVRPKEILYDSLAFRRCSEGVEYGMNNYVMDDDHENVSSLVSLACLQWRM